MKGPESAMMVAVLLAAIGMLGGAVGIFLALVTESFELDKSILGTVLGIVTFASYIGGAGMPLVAGLFVSSIPMFNGFLFGLGGFALSGLATFYAFKKRDVQLKSEHLACSKTVKIMARAVIFKCKNLFLVPLYAPALGASF